MTKLNNSIHKIHKKQLHMKHKKLLGMYIRNKLIKKNYIFPPLYKNHPHKNIDSYPE